MSQSRIRRYLWATVCVGPALLLVVAFSFIPAFYAAFLSVFRSEFLLIGRKFVGMGNYTSLLHSPEFWQAMGHTFVYTFWSVVAQFAIGLALALTLQRRLRVNEVFRTLLLLPWAMSPVIVAVLFEAIYFPGQAGLLNYVLLRWHLTPHAVTWLDINLAMTMVIIANIWFGTPFSMLIQIAGLQAIPQEVKEAARVDGATPLSQFWRITLPLLKPTILVNLVWISISTFNEFDLVYSLTRGGPLEATNMLGLYMYRLAFQFGQFENGAAVAVLMFLINAALSLGYIRLLRTESYY